MKYFPILLLVFSLLVSCGGRNSKVLSEDETIDLLADLQIAESYVANLPSQKQSPENRKMAQGILAKHGVSREVFDSTMSYYGRNIDELYKLYDKVNERIDRKSAKYIDIKKSEQNSDDNIWPYPAFTYVSENQMTDGLVFSFGAEDVSVGDRLEWNMNFNKSVNGVVLLGLEYTDGTSGIMKRNTGMNPKMTLSLQADTAKTPKRVYGYVTVTPEEMPLWIDSISLMRHKLDTLNYQIRSVQRIFRPRKKVNVIADTIESHEEVLLVAKNKFFRN